MEFEKLVDKVKKLECEKFWNLPAARNTNDCIKRFEQVDRIMVRAYVLTTLPCSDAPRLRIRRVGMPKRGGNSIFTQKTCTCSDKPQLKFENKNKHRAKINQYLKDWLRAADKYLKEGLIEEPKVQRRGRKSRL